MILNFQDTSTFLDKATCSYSTVQEEEGLSVGNGLLPHPYKRQIMASKFSTFHVQRPKK